MAKPYIGVKKLNNMQIVRKQLIETEESRQMQDHLNFLVEASAKLEENCLKALAKQILKRDPIPEDFERFTKIIPPGATANGYYIIAWDGVELGKVKFGDGMKLAINKTPGFSIRFEPFEEHRTKDTKAGRIPFFGKNKKKA